MKKLFTFLVGCAALGSVFAQDAQLTSWKLNMDGTTASYYKTQMGPGPNNGQTTLVELSDLADIKEVYYDDDYVYVTCDGLSSTIMGPWSISNEPSAQDYTYKIPRSPQEATVKPSVPAGGSVGFATDGIALFGYESAESWIANQSTVGFNGDEIWNADAWVTEGETMDASLGAHAQQQGAYHYHATPFDLYDEANTSDHSPIVGWAPDGYPLYGPYGYDDPLNSESDVVRIESGYAKREITERHRLPNASSDLSANEWGPDVNDDYPLGYFVEDYEYNASSGHLDEYNGRYCKTPEYPNGTYAYFVTIDELSEPAHPYIFSTEYYGEASTNDIGRATIPSNAVKYDPTTTAIGDLINNSSEISPNPTTGVISTPVGAVSIYNILGEVMLEVMSEGSLDLGSLQSGIYLVSSEKGTERVVLK